MPSFTVVKLCKETGVMVAAKKLGAPGNILHVSHLNFGANV
jgi:hypothetical protein